MPAKSQTRLIDLIGQKFGLLTVVSRAENTKRGLTRWHCKCDCGAQHTVERPDLVRGKTKSCGCLFKSHGMTNTPEFKAWEAMLTRCYNPRATGYQNYGGKGIVVCDEWRESFIQFLQDMGLKPSLRHSLDRWPDNKGNYEPGNCRWATAKQQNRNKECIRLVTLDGELIPLAEAAEKYSIARRDIYYRLKAGWSTEDAFKTPVRHYARHNHRSKRCAGG